MYIIKSMVCIKKTLRFFKFIVYEMLCHGKGERPKFEFVTASIQKPSHGMK